MRSKRVFTLLLALCLVLSLMAPSVTAVSVTADVAAGSTQQNVTPGSSSSNKNDLLVGNDGALSNGLNTLRNPISFGSNKVESEGSKGGNWTVTPVDKVSGDLLDAELPSFIQELREAAELYKASDVVSAFVVMKDEPLVETFSNILNVPESMKQQLVKQQDALVSLIEKTVLNGKKLDVENQFTYLTNSLVINTEFANLEKIAVLPGVETVFLTPVYQACSTEKIASPLTVSAGEMSGVPTVWNNPELGYTGKGMTVAVIDTGLDMDHPAFAADPELGETSWDAAYVEGKLADLNAHAINPNLTAEDLYCSAKLPYTFNYVKGTTNVNHDAETGDHGSHVAGIVAANPVDGTGAVGMAPDAQLVIMQVFTPGGGAALDHILAALEDAMTLECDVANLSLGSPAGFSSEDPEIDKIYNRISETDIIVDIAAGNEATSSYANNWGTDLNLTAHIDNATISSPATYANAMAVASIDNAMITSPYFTLGGETVAYNDGQGLYVPFSSLAGEPLEYVMVPGLGEEADFEGLDVAGKIAVVNRGVINFSTKLANAEAAGAIGMIVTNNVPGSISSFGMTLVDDYGNLPEGVSGMVPAIMVTMTAGQKLAEAENKVIEVSAEDGLIPDEFGGQVSSFSSWGVTPDLRLLPDIAGVGGSVYSCYDGGQYGLMSGTSMASPQVAGVTALVLQYLKELYPNATASEIRVLADSLLMSTAVPVVTPSGLEASPRQQGAGLVNALNAVTSEAYLTVEGSERPKAELGDSEDGTYSFTFTVHNYSDAAKTYTLSSSLLTEDFVEIDGKEYMAGYEHGLDSSAVSFTAETVTVAPGETADVTVTITLTDADKAWIDEHFANGSYVEGYVYLTAGDGVDLNLPFLGFYGDWSQSPLFDTAYWYGNSFWNEEAPYEGAEYWHVFWTSLGGTDWVLGFNPYTGAMLDDEGNVVYDPANNVISNNNDGLLDGFQEIYLSLMRNANTVSFTYTDADGNTLHTDTLNKVTKTMYISSYGQVVPSIYSWYSYDFYDFTDANGDPLPSGTKLTLTVSGEIDYEGGMTHYLEEIPITLDTQAATIVGTPVETSVDGRNYLTLTVADDSLAYVALMNPSGTQVYGGYGDTDFVKNANGTYTVTLDVTGYGNDMVVALCDYGANEGYYQLTYSEDNLPEVDKDALYAYRVYDDAIYDDSLYGWVTLDKDDAETHQLTNDMYEYYSLTAAEYAGGYVFAVDAGYNFMYMIPGLWNRNVICNLGVNVVDMAFDETTGTMYLATKTTGEDGYSTKCALYTVDLLTGELTQVATYRSQYEMPWAMTFVDGELYAIKYYYSGLYEVDPDNGYALEAVTCEDGTDFVPVTSAGDATSAVNSQSMTYSEADGMIYWAYFKTGWQGTTAELFAIDPVTLEYTATPFAVGAELVGVLTLEDDGYTLPESEEITKLVMSQESLILREGESAALSASALPWNAPAVQITWTSDDETVATVDANGEVTGVSAGRAVITASYGDVSASCVVNVVHIEGTVYAYNYFNGTGSFGDWLAIDLETMDAESMGMSPVDFVSADYNGHDGNVYGYDEFGQLHSFNPVTGESAALGAPVTTIPMDMAYDYSTGFMYAVTVDEMNGVSTLNYVNMNNGALVKVADVYGLYLLTLACDTDGGLYAMSSDGTLFYLYLYEAGMGGGVMPLADGEGEVTMAIEPVFIMDGFGGLFYQQSMCFDHNSYKLIWANAEASTIYWIDLFASEPYAVSLGDPTGSGLMEFMGLYTIPEEIPELAYTPVQSVTAEDMMLLTGGKKMPAVSVYPLNATNQTITWTSADEAVAYVDEDGMVVGAGEGVTTLTGTLVDGENTLEVTLNVTVKESAGTVYGYVLTDLATYGGFAWAEVDDSNPNYPEYPASSNYMIYSQEYVNGKVYAYGVDSMEWTANWQFMTIDPETYEIESTIDMGEGFPFVYDMTYDYTTGTMYAVAGYDDYSSDVYMIDMETGKLMRIMDAEPFFMSIAAAPDGTLYAMAQSEFDYWTYSAGNAMLYKLDVKNGTYELAFDTGVKSNMLASMTFDRASGDLYWSALYQGEGGSSNGLYRVDLETQTSYDLGSIGVLGSQMVGLYIIADSYPEVPDELMNALMTSTLEELFVGETVTLSTFLQPSGLDAQIIWSSSDETVATVDENGVVTTVGAGVATITATVTYKGETRTAHCAIIVYGDDSNFLSYNATEHGWTNIALNDVTVESVIATDAEELSGVQSMVMVDGVIYAYDKDNKFFKTTEESGFVREYLGEADVEMLDLSADGYDCLFEIADLAYDPVNDRVLAIGAHLAYDPEYGDTIPLEFYSKLYEVDLQTGHMTEVVALAFDEYTSAQNIYAMTVTPDGTVYVYETYSDYICTVDMETGLLTKLNSTSRQSVYGGSDCEDMAMEYDPITCDIFLLMTSNGNFYTMFKFDPVSTALTNLGRVGEVIYDDASWAYMGDAFAGLIIDAEHTHAWGAGEIVTEPTCTEDGVSTRVCLLCGETEVPAALGHSYEAVVTEPTTEAEGYTTHTCETCGHSYKDSYTDKLPPEDPDNSDTGDTFQAGLLAALAAVSAACLAVLVIGRKKFGWN